MSSGSSSQFDSLGFGAAAGSLPVGEMPLVEQTKSEIRILAAEISRLAASRLAPADFLEAFLPRLRTAMGATGVAVWEVTEGGEFRLLGELSLPPALRSDSRPSDSHRSILHAVVSEGHPVVVPPRTVAVHAKRPTNPIDQALIVVPVAMDDRPELLVEVVQPSTGGPAAQRGYLRFVVQMSQFVADFYRRHRLRVWRETEQRIAFQEKLLFDIASCEQVAAARRLAADGLCDLAEAEIAIVASSRARRPVLAVSGVAAPDPRSEIVMAAAELICRLRRAALPPAGMIAVVEATERRAAPEDAPTSNARVTDRDSLSQRDGNSAGASYADSPDADVDGPSSAGSGRVGPLQTAKIRESVDQLAAATRCRSFLIVRPATAPHQVLLFGYVSSVDAAAQTAGNPGELQLQPALQRAVDAVARLLATVRPHTVWWWSASRRATVREKPAWHGALHRITAWIAIGGLLAAIAWFPIPEQIAASGVLTPESKVAYYAPQRGIVDEVLVREGDEVVVGQPLVAMGSPELDQKIAAVMGEIEVQRRRLATARVLYRGENGLDQVEIDRLEAEMEQLELSLAALESQMQLLQQQRAELLIRAVAPGRVATWNLLQRLANKPVMAGEVLLHTFEPDGPWRIEAVVAEHRGGLVRRALESATDGLPCQIVFASHPDTIVPARLTRLAAQSVATPGPTGGERHMLPARIEVDASRLPIREDGAAARVMIHCGHQPFGWLVCRDAYWAVSSWFRMLW